jgi:hypothetical protein
MAGLTPTNKKSRRKSSLSIDKMLNQINELQNFDLKLLSSYMENQISKLNFAYDQIAETDLNPIKFEASRAYQNGKTRLKAYLEEKNKKSEEMNQLVLTKMLRQPTIRSPSNGITFSSFKDQEVLGLVSKNKRKFGGGWKFKGYSHQTSPFESGNSSNNLSPKNTDLLNAPNSVKNSPTSRNANLNAEITKIINKKLGIAPKKKEFAAKKLIIKKKTSNNTARTTIRNGKPKRRQVLKSRL